MTRSIGYNRRLAKKRVQCLNETLCPENRDSVLADSLVLRNPPLRQAPKPSGKPDSASSFPQR